MGNMTQKWVDILIPFSQRYDLELSASDLSRKMKTPQQTISRVLNNLVNHNLINYRINGRNKLFSLDFGLLSTSLVFNMVENKKSLLFLMKIKKLKVLLNELGRCCECFIVFGSYAKYKARKDSDLDILILGKHNKIEIQKIKKKHIIEINEHYLSYSGFLRTLKSKEPLAIEIFENHIIFGNISKVVNIFFEVVK